MVLGRRRHFATNVVFLAVVYFCFIYTVKGTSEGDAPSGRSAEIMTHMFGAVKPYAYQQKKTEAKQPVEKSSVEKGAAVPKQAVDEFSITDNSKMPTVDPAKFEEKRPAVVQAEPTKKAEAAPSPPKEQNVAKPSPPKEQNVAKPSAPQHAEPKRVAAPTVAKPFVTPKQADKLFDRVFSKEGNGKTATAETTAKRKNKPEIATSLVEEKGKTAHNPRENDGRWVKNLRGIFKRTSKPILNEAFVEERAQKIAKAEENRRRKALERKQQQEAAAKATILVETKEASRQQARAAEPMQNDDRLQTMNTAQTMSAVTALNNPQFAHPVNSLWNPLNQGSTPQADTYASAPSPGFVNQPVSTVPNGNMVPPHSDYQSGYQAGLAAAQQNAPSLLQMNNNNNRMVQPMRYQQQQQPMRFQQQQQPMGFQQQQQPMGFQQQQQPMRFQQQPRAQVPTQANSYKAGYAAAKREQQGYQAGFKAAMKMQMNANTKPGATFARQQEQVKEKLAHTPSQKLIPRSILKIDDPGMTAKIEAGAPAVPRNSAFLEAAAKLNAKKDAPVYNGNYLQNWPPPSEQHTNLMAPLLARSGIAPAVPPPTPPQIGMSPAPPVSSRVLNTPDVLPQAPPPTHASDARYPTQSDAHTWDGGHGTEKVNKESEGEPLIKSPQMTPFGKDDTMNAMG